jgi:hypothetical protein
VIILAIGLEAHAYDLLLKVMCVYIQLWVSICVGGFVYWVRLQIKRIYLHKDTYILRKLYMQTVYTRYIWQTERIYIYIGIQI